MTTIVGRRWILSRGLKLAVIKCLQSPEYLSVLGRAIGRTVGKGMQDGLAAGINHGKAGRALSDVVTHNPYADANYVVAFSALRDMDFSLLTLLASQKDANIANIMDYLRLEGPSAEIPGAGGLQPSHEQLMLSIDRPEDNMVLGETSLSFSLESVSVSAPPLSVTDYGVVHARPQVEDPSSGGIVFKKEELKTSPDPAVDS
ncbi:hypothetical protein Tco_1177617 [Tanacetum coccineum]